MGNRRFVLMVISDDEEDEAPPPLRAEEEQQQHPTSQRKRKKMKLCDEEEREEEGVEEERAKRRNRTREGEHSRNGGGCEDEETQEHARPVGEVRKISSERKTRLTHYSAFEYDGVRYELEDSVLLVPEAPNQKPYVAIIKDITQNIEGNMMVTGQRFYRPEEAQKRGCGNWQSHDRRELFYSFHHDDVPAESVMCKCVVHFIPLNKQIPNCKQHPGFIVQKVYDTEQRRLFKLTDEDYEDTKQGELDELVQKTSARLGDLPDIETEDNHTDQEDQLKNKRLLRRKNMSPLDISMDDETMTNLGQPLKAETPGNVTSNTSEYYTILSNFKALTGETQRDKWLERLLQGIQFICSPMDSGRGDAKEDLHNSSSKGANGAEEKSGETTFIWPDSAVPALTALEKASHDALSTDFQKYNQKMRQLVFNLKNNALLARRLLNGELEPSKIMNMSPTELKMYAKQSIEFTYVHASRVLPPKAKLTTHSGIHQLQPIRGVLRDYEVLDRFQQGPFGHFMQMPLSKQVSAPQLIHQVLLRQVTFPGARKDEMWFEIGGQIYRYNKQEFILITGLRFGAIDRAILEAMPTGDANIRGRLFPQKQEYVTVEDIRELLIGGKGLQGDEILRLAYLAVVEVLLLGHDDRSKVDDFLWSLIEDLNAFMSFPWGTYIYSQDLHYLQMVTSSSKITCPVGKKVNLYGFSWAFQWWLIETFPWVESKLAIKPIGAPSIPRCMKWWSKNRPRLLNYAECLPNVRGSSTTLEPTDAERDTDFWKSFNPLHSVGDEVYKNGGGGEEELDGGDKREEDDGKTGRLLEEVDGREMEEEKEEEVEEKEEFVPAEQSSMHSNRNQSWNAEMLQLMRAMSTRLDTLEGTVERLAGRVEDLFTFLRASDIPRHRYHFDDAGYQHHSGDYQF